MAISYQKPCEVVSEESTYKANVAETSDGAIREEDDCIANKEIACIALRVLGITEDRDCKVVQIVASRKNACEGGEIG